MDSSGTALDSDFANGEASDWTRHRVTDPQRESGIPPARTRHPAERTLVDESDDHVQLALAESARTEANLASLLRGLSHLAAGASAARDANLALFHELDKVRELLGQSNSEERVLRQQLRFLEQTLESERQDTVRRRATFIAEEDAFLAELLADHEREIVTLRRRLEQALGLPAQEPAHESSIAPTSNPPSTLASLKLRTIKVPLAAQELPLHLSPPRPSSRPPLRQKADPATRPLVEYSLGKSDVAEERLGSDQATETPRMRR